MDDDQSVRISIMYRDTATVLGSCYKPRARLAVESKIIPMRTGTEGMTVGRSFGIQVWFHQEVLFSRPLDIIRCVLVADFETVEHAIQSTVKAI